jgi:hypothetical protein
MVNMTEDVTVEKNENEVKPEGADFFVDLPDGHRVWFRDFKQSQRLMLYRASDASSAARIKIHEGSGTAEEKLKALTELALKADKRIWDAIDSIVIDPDDIERIMDAFTSGAVGDEWSNKVIAGGRTDPVVADDDAEEVAPSKPSRRANAKRTQVK